MKLRISYPLYTEDYLGVAPIRSGDSVIIKGVAYVFSHMQAGWNRVNIVPCTTNVVHGIF